jgi:hypothetical protein
VYRVGAAASSAATSPAVDIEVLIEVIAQAAVRGVRTRAAVERVVTIAAQQCIAADGAVGGDDVPVVWPVTSIAAISAREPGGAPRRQPANGEKRDGSVARKPTKAPPDASTRSPKKGLSCPTTH